MSAPRRVGDPVRLVRGRQAGAEGYVEAYWGAGRYWARVNVDGATRAVPRAMLERIPRRRRGAIERGRYVGRASATGLESSATVVAPTEGET